MTPVLRSILTPDPHRNCHICVSQALPSSGRGHTVPNPPRALWAGLGQPGLALGLPDAPL